MSTEPVAVHRNQALGRYGEALAARYLEDRGMVVLERNWRCTSGEIDLVLRDGDVLVLCEVKTRSGTHFGTPQEAFDERKARRLRLLAARWLQERRLGRLEVRIDLVAILRPRRGPSVIDHLRGVG